MKLWARLPCPRSSLVPPTERWQRNMWTVNIPLETELRGRDDCRLGRCPASNLPKRRGEHNSYADNHQQTEGVKPALCGAQEELRHGARAAARARAVHLWHLPRGDDPRARRPGVPGSA